MPTEKHVSEAIEKLEKGKVKITDIFASMEKSSLERGYRFVDGWKIQVEDILVKMTKNGF